MTLSEVSVNKIVYAQLILQIGSVCFYECKSNTFLFGRPVYYWKFMSSSDYFGPFNTLLEAGSSVDHHVRGPTQTIATLDVQPTLSVQQDTKNVIRVDFKAKKRIK